MFVPPINLGQFQPSPATLADWIYQIWNYLQNNPIATQEQIQEYIGTFITTSPETQELIGEGVEQYLTDNPPQSPVQSVQGKTGAVTLNYPDIVPASNAVPVYRAASAPNTSAAQGLYNNGYRLFVNTTTQEIYTISPAGALSLVGRGKFDGTTVDLNSADGDTTIAEAINENKVEGGSGYCKLPDGTLINYLEIQVQNVVISQSWGAMYETASAIEFGTWAYPFIDNAISTAISVFDGNPATPESHDGITRTSAGKAYFYRPITGTVNLKIHVIGIGRWK
jgi:hypothetical protein